MSSNANANAKANAKRDEKSKSRLKRMLAYFNRPATETYEFTDEDAQPQRRKGAPGLAITGMAESKDRYIESQKKLGKYEKEEDLGNLLEDVRKKLPQVEATGFLNTFYNTVLKDTQQPQPQQPQPQANQYEELDQLISELEGQYNPADARSDDAARSDDDARSDDLSINSDLDTEGRMQALLQDYMNSDSDMGSNIESDDDIDDILAQRTNILSQYASDAASDGSNNDREPSDAASDAIIEEPLGIDIDIDMLDNTTRHRFTDIGDTTDDFSDDVDSHHSRVFSPNVK
jgi:hypothetical protein